VDDLIPILTKFHREIVVPDIEQIVGASERRVRDEMHTLFDALAQRLDRLETEYQMLVVGLKRVEERLERVEQQLDKMALRSDLLELKSRVNSLQEQVRTLESRLEE
jgi:chromosome segregation ATPase